VHDALSRLGFSRSVNPVTRTIDHANLFLLVDAEGRIAYRFSLDARLRTWLRDAILALAAEAEGRS
jgi:cytochrome oxidase Cu insertion factor (SCO1/SenC/PrrC family)